jgi:integrase
MADACMTYTLSDLLTAYEQEYLPTKSPITDYQSRTYFARLRRELGSMLLTDLTPAFLRQWRDTLAQRHSPGTVRRYLHLLSGPLSVAVRDYEWLATHPLRKVRKPPEPASRVRFLSDEERGNLLAACQISRNPHLYTIVLLALSIGARKDQLRFLRWRDLDLAQGLIRIGTSKRTRPRSLPLLGPILPLLQRQRLGQPPDAWVFARHDGRKPISFDAAFKVACKRAKVLDFKFHDLRHSCGSYLAMSGATLRDIAEVLGHRTIQMSMKYAHLTEQHTASVLQRMADQFLALLLAACTLTTLASVALVWG